VSKQNAEEKTLTNQSPSHFSPNSEVVHLQKVGVRYRLPSERIGSFKEYTIRWIQRKVTHRDFWALQDVSLNVNRGETLGLIGHNGAGKSTLLKLIARVFRPTSGRVVVTGKVAPLLEFGAGFHPELTGRENIYLNGALMGFSHQEMEGKLEGIVNFAELWDFIDVPMRTYSSGMWARLGFAVATDVRPDILLIDEVLSVGDESFKRKSSARMQEFQDRGATIILVSHDMEMIQNMCNRVAWLDHGQLKVIGEANEVIQAYCGSQNQ
jgi:ABC-2 type transport system ATP-binding protein/lipopolysaccharide transport system ATP-binding protein